MNENMTFKAKIKNIWDYDKWYILGGLLVIVLVIFFVKDTFFAEKIDNKILYVSRGYLNTQQVSDIEAYFGLLSDDRDGNGEKTVKLLNFEFAPDPESELANSQLEKETRTKLMVETGMQDSCFYIMKKEFADSVFEGKTDSLLDLSEIDPSIEAGTRFLPIDKTVLREKFSFIPEDAVVLIKLPYKEGYEAYLESAKLILQGILVK